MKLGLTFRDLIDEVDRQAEAKRDLVAPTESIIMKPETAHVEINGEEFPVRENAHKQIATYTGIGTRYYEKMQKDSPALLAGNVNHWLHKDDKRRLVRTLDGDMRAFLSDQYLRLDNDIALNTSLQVLDDVRGFTGLDIKSSHVTDSKFYLKAVFPRVEREVSVGDIVQMGICITNSEIGQGSISVQALLYRLVCDNGMTVNVGKDGYRRTHRGRAITSQNIEYSRDTIELQAQATIGEFKDAITTFTSQRYIDGIVNKLQEAKEGEQITQPIPAVTELSKQIGLADFERDKVIESLIRDQDLSRYGLMNAVTNIANDHESYDRASELEGLGDKVLNLSRSKWDKIINSTDEKIAA